MNLIGYIDHVTHFYVIGWVADLDDLTRKVRLGVFIDGQGATVAEASQYRQGLEAIAPAATGHYAFRCYFPVAMQPYRRHEVVLRVEGADFSMKAEIPAFADGSIPESDPRYRPRGPILLTSLGRSGSTAVMAILANHPGILVSGGPPYEVELGCYYAHALRTLAAAGDHVRSLRSDQITSLDNLYHIGFNPYMDPSFTSSFGGMGALREFTTRNVPIRIASAFRDIILDYYQALAKIQSKAEPRYFAEKTLPEPASRLGIHYMFPNIKEIVLVRDLRDAICSFSTHSHTPFAQALSGARSAARRFLEIKSERKSSIMFVRYEDFVLRREDTLGAIFEFIDLPQVAYQTEVMDKLFATHATSRSPAESIGRWRRDLTSEQLRECRGLDRFLAEFGYGSG